MATWPVRWTDAVRPYRASDVEVIEAEELATTGTWLTWWGLRWVIGQPRMVVVLRVSRRAVVSID
jgi:hypothetical protein